MFDYVNPTSSNGFNLNPMINNPAINQPANSSIAASVVLATLLGNAEVIKPLPQRQFKRRSKKDLKREEEDQKVASINEDKLSRDNRSH